MEFLELNQIWEWARENALVVDERFSVRLPKYRALYSEGARSGDEVARARELVLALGGWDEAVVWIREWGVWPSHEDWPAFYAWRGAREERRSLETAPGHMFQPADSSGLVDLIRLIMENAWDADVLCTRNRDASRARAHVSHDGWFEVFAAQGVKA